MNPWRWVDPRVQSVRVSDLGAYFRHKGWTLKPNPNPNLLRFEESTARKGAVLPADSRIRPVR